MRFLLILILVPGMLSAQNLLVNGGFEEENICVEYKVNCAPEGWMYTVPSFIYYFKDARMAHKGGHFVGLLAGHSKKRYYRTFVRSRLMCALQKGHMYNLEFYVKSPHRVLDSMAVYFSGHDFLFEKRLYHRITPSVFLTDAAQKPVNGDTSWQKVVIHYKASGDEKYITLGNFSKRDITGYTGIDKENNFFVLFDDISLTATIPEERLCADWQKTREDIYKQDERHEYLAFTMKKYRNNPPKITPPTPTIILNVDTLVIPDVLFATNSFILNKTAVSVLDSFGKKAGQYGIDSLIVIGHTDATGTDQHNQELSFRRASSVAAFLQPHIPVKIDARGMGATMPVADNRTASGKQRNRRVEIYVYKKGKRGS